MNGTDLDQLQKLRTALSELQFHMAETQRFGHQPSNITLSMEKKLIAKISAMENLVSAKILITNP